MKVLILVTGGRGGSDFFQGLLDQHNEILQIPGILRINNQFKDIFNSSNNKELAQKFINYIPYIFDSRKNKIERHNKLGKGKNEFYIINKKLFVSNFENLSKKNTEKLKKIDILKNLYKAYFLASGKKINDLKLIILHTHTVSLTKKLFDLTKIENCFIIHTMRNPINAVSSPVYNWLKFKNGINFFPKDLYFQYDLAINGLSDLCKMKKKVYVILLENLIKHKKKVMQDFCKIFKLKFSNKMLDCTYFGKQWWGDEISGRWIDKKIHSSKLNQNEINNNIFFKKDLCQLNNLTKYLSNKYFKKN